VNQKTLIIVLAVLIVLAIGAIGYHATGMGKHHGPKAAAGAHDTTVTPGGAAGGAAPASGPAGAD
jgi:flagellar basal body-associated protein FliL